jgi:hypothetical protein
VRAMRTSAVSNRSLRKAITVLPFALGWAMVGPGCSKKEPELQKATASDGVALAAGAKAEIKPNKAPLKCEPGPDGQCAMSPLCSPKCQKVSTPDCVKCEEAGPCAPFVKACEQPHFTPEERQLCFDIQACVQTSNCFDGDTTIGQCYCGKLDTAACLAAPMSGKDAPDGPCRDLILKGFPNATKQTHVLGNLQTRASVSGWALSRLNCQKVGNWNKCSKLCGFAANSPAFPE